MHMYVCVCVCVCTYKSHGVPVMKKQNLSKVAAALPRPTDVLDATPTGAVRLPRQVMTPAQPRCANSCRLNLYRSQEQMKSYSSAGITPRLACPR